MCIYDQKRGKKSPCPLNHLSKIQVMGKETT